MGDQQQQKIKMIDLFAGTGAFSLAFESTGKVECVFANDYCKESKAIYDANHETKLTLQNLNTVNVEQQIPLHDILCGGFPCQPFSIAGKQKGFDDARSNVFWKIIEIVKRHTPRVIVLENVKNLCSHDNGNTFQVIRNALTNEGYHIKHRVLNTCMVTSIPQNRERIYIVCFREQEDHDRFTFDDILETKNTDDINEHLEEKIPEKYFYGPKYKVWDTIQEQVTKSITEENVVYQYRRFYVHGFTNIN